MVNAKLRAARKEKCWTMAIAAEKAGVSWLTYSRWENGLQTPYLSTLSQLCEAFGKTPQELGFSHIIKGTVREKSSKPDSPIIILTQDEATELLSLLGENMTHFDETKRATLQRLLKAAGTVGIALTLPQDISDLEPWKRLAFASEKHTNIDQDTLEHFAELNRTCWDLTNGTGIKAINQILPTYLPYLPQITALAHQSSPHRAFAASLAAQGYLLTGLVALDEYHLPEMQRSSTLAVQHSQLAGDYNLLAASYKQQATMFLIAGETIKALQIYQKTLPFIKQVSPLLRSRIYQGLASANARCGQEKNALRYLGLAQDTFPSDFINDPSYLYADSGLSVLHLYEGLTHLDLNNPQEAWAALAKVDGLAPKIPIGELTRLEFLNLQAKTAVAMGEMELCELYLETSVTIASAISSQYGNKEAIEIYQNMQNRWPKETRIKTLGELFHL